MKDTVIQRMKTPPSRVTRKLFEDVRALIEQSRQRVAYSANSELVMLNWHVGLRLKKDILGDTRGEYGERIVQTLSA